MSETPLCPPQNNELKIQRGRGRTVMPIFPEPGLSCHPKKQIINPKPTRGGGFVFPKAGQILPGMYALFRLAAADSPLPARKSGIGNGRCGPTLGAGGGGAQAHGGAYLSRGGPILPPNKFRDLYLSLADRFLSKLRLQLVRILMDRHVSQSRDA